MSLSFGSYFTTPDLWYDYRGTYRQGQAQLADTNGDGMADLLFQSTANVFGDSASTGTGFAPPQGWRNYARSLVRPDSSYLPSAVVIIPSPAGEHQHGLVVIPQGTLLDTNGSTTSGFNEAIEYSMLDGRDIFVYGKGKFSATGNYHFDSPIEFPAIQGKTVQMYDVTLNFGPGVTGSAIVFDSSMMGDFQIFGTINAPYAEYGVQLLPRNPHPLDGCAYGIDSAIVDSRFYFDHIITASPNVKKVGFPRQSWLDQLTGNLDELGGVVSNTLYIGDGIDDYGAAIENHAEFVRPGAMNVLKDNRRKKSLADPADPANEVYHDIFRPDAVVIQAPLGELHGGPDSIGKVYLPGGAEVDVSHSRSSGLREAAALSTQLDVDLFVYGRGFHGGINWIEEVKVNGECDSDTLWNYVDTVINPGREVPFTKGAHNLDWGVVIQPPPKTNGIYGMRDSVVFNHIKDRSVMFFTATFHVSGPVDRLFQFREAAGAFFEFTGQVVGHYHAEDIFYFEPLNADIADSTFYLGTSLAKMHNVYFNTQNGNITGNQFFLHEMNMAKHSVTIGNPSAHHVFANNYLEAAHVHSFSDIALQVGESQLHADRIRNNTILAVVNSDGKPINIGLQIWAAGENNVYPDLDLSGDFNRGVSIEPGASGNTVYYKKLDGYTPVFMAGGTEDNNTVQPH